MDFYTYLAGSRVSQDRAGRWMVGGYGLTLFSPRRSLRQARHSIGVRLLGDEVEFGEQVAVFVHAGVFGGE